tara:strand:- start:39 stop:584 length:546 start_codon:yes stop_codon:yes gene_type:complete
MKEGPYMPKDKIKDIFFIGGFASIFHFLGCLMVLIFSIRTTLECDRTQDICSLSSEYVLRSPDKQTWRLSEMKRAYVETQYPTGTPEEQRGKSTFYRAVITLQYKKVPFHSSYSTNREKIQELVDDLESFITGNTSNEKNTETFIYSEYTLGFVIAIGGGLNLAGFAILYWFLWPILKRES